MCHLIEYSGVELSNLATRVIFQSENTGGLSDKSEVRKLVIVILIKYNLSTQFTLPIVLIYSHY